MKKILIIGLIIYAMMVLNGLYKAQACLPEENPVGCENNNPKPEPPPAPIPPPGPPPCPPDQTCPPCWQGGGSGGGIGSGGGAIGIGSGGGSSGPINGGPINCPPGSSSCNPQGKDEPISLSHSSGIVRSAYSVVAPGMNTTYVDEIAAGKYFVAFKLSLLNQSTNGRFSLTPTLNYCSDFHVFAQNEQGKTMFGPGWFSDFEIYLSKRTGGAEGDLLFRTPTGHPRLMVKQQESKLQMPQELIQNII